ncbi:hypothetical protein ACSYDW_01355 [Paeniglutamicibacter sp. R2-26]|uniref:hypothetical protein n=1 Tax=Paeniglutamicibacter sp. R2-26 TaxID=3144417 RepID=UPI003EE5CA92
MSYGEAVHLVEQLQLDHGSHLTMSINNWTYPASRMDLYQMATFAKLVNIHKNEDDPIFTLEWPWPSENAVPEVTAEERADARADLARNSAFG